MKPFLQLVLIITSTLLFSIGTFTLIEEVRCNINKEEVVVGQEYLHSYQFEEENPFAIYDTVKVMAIANGFVQFQFKNCTGCHYFSSTLNTFRRTVKLIK